MKPAPKLGLPSPWARAGIPEAERPAIEALIPDGYRIVVIGDAYGFSRRFTLHAYTTDNARVMTWAGRHDPVNAATEMARGLGKLAAA